MGSIVTRGLILALGYAYPAYECFKTVERKGPIERILFWCQYWILVAVLTIFERVGDELISWLPMYSEAKLVFFIYLWHPRTTGTTFIYETFFQPFIANHQIEIDKALLKVKNRVGKFSAFYWQKTFAHGAKRFYEILQYIASQSRPPRSQPVQQQQQLKVGQPPAGVPYRRFPFPYQSTRTPGATSNTAVKSSRSASTMPSREGADPSKARPSDKTEGKRWFSWLR